MHKGRYQHIKLLERKIRRDIQRKGIARKRDTKEVEEKER
jgi:hypothetical protein